MKKVTTIHKGQFLYNLPEDFKKIESIMVDGKQIPFELMNEMIVHSISLYPLKAYHPEDNEEMIIEYETK